MIIMQFLMHVTILRSDGYHIWILDTSVNCMKVRKASNFFVPVYFLYIQTSIFVDFEHDRLTHRSEDGSMLGFPHLIGFTTCMVSIDFI